MLFALMHGYFKMSNVSCHIVFDTSLFTCKIHILDVTMAGPCHVHTISGHHRLFVFALFTHYAILIMCYVWMIPHLIYGDGYLIYNITVGSSTQLGATNSLCCGKFLIDPNFTAPRLGYR